MYKVLQHGDSDLGHSFEHWLLFYGCWGDDEQIYKDEMAQYKESGALQDYHVAKSRKPDAPKVSSFYFIPSKR